MGDLTKLIAGVEALTGPDRETDAAIGYELDINIAQERDGVTIYGRVDPDGWSFPGRGYDPLMLVKPYTASIDAAVALTERVLPGWAFGFDKGAKTCIAFTDVSDFADRFLGARYTAEGPTPAIALILATLKALEAREKADE